MKRISIVGLCLMAVFAFSAGAASSASAADLLAQIAGGGSIAGVTFLSSAGLVELFTHGGSEIPCKDATNHGLFLSSTLGDILIRFIGCTFLGACKSLGAGKEEIHLPLATTLFHLGLAHLTSSVGRIPAILISLTKDVHMQCGEPVVLADLLVLGAVIGALRLDVGSHGPIPLNTPFSTALLSFEQTANGLQHLRLFLMPGTTGFSSYDLDLSVNGGPAELVSKVANALLDLFRLSNGKHVSLELVEP